MQIIWAPERMKYIIGEPPSGCIFCDKPKQGRDAENHILAHGETCFVILNAFPYNNGHLMVVPHRHVSRLSDLETEELAEMMSVSAMCEQILSEALHPDGFNIGMNIGKVAGAGIDAHIHLHIVPRWNGDTNYMPVVAETKVIPDSLENTYQHLHPLFAQRMQSEAGD